MHYTSIEDNHIQLSIFKLRIDTRRKLNDALEGAHIKRPDLHNIPSPSTRFQFIFGLFATNVIATADYE